MTESAGLGDCEVLIVGGGPAGLLLATLLAPRYRVTVAERRRVGQTSKYWITSRRRLEAHGLGDCVYSAFSSAIFGTFLGNPIAVPGDFVVAAEQQVLARLSERAMSTGVTILEECPVTAVRWLENAVVATTPVGPIPCSVLVDASGGSSPIAASFRLHTLYGYYTVYGQHFQSVALASEQLIAGVVPELGYPPIIFEVIPIPPASVICSAFVVTRRARHSSELRPSLERFVRGNEFFAPTAQTTLKSEKFGAIPIGRLSRRRLPRVIGFGEAGMMQAPLLGGAFNEVLVHAAHFSERLAGTLAGRRATARQIHYGAQKRVNDWIQLALARILVDGTALGLQRLAEGLARIGPGRAYRFLASELSATEVPRVTLSALIPARAISKPDSGSKRGGQGLFRHK